MRQSDCDTPWVAPHSPVRKRYLAESVTLGKYSGCRHIDRLLRCHRSADVQLPKSNNRVHRPGVVLLSTHRRLVAGQRVWPILASGWPTSAPGSVDMLPGKMRWRVNTCVVPMIVYRCVTASHICNLHRLVMFHQMATPGLLCADAEGRQQRFRHEKSCRRPALDVVMRRHRTCFYLWQWSIVVVDKLIAAVNASASGAACKRPTRALEKSRFIEIIGV